MLFAHDTAAALRAAAALVNAPLETSAAPGALAALLDDWGQTGRRDGDAAELEAVRELQGALRRAWTAPPDEVVAELNALLARGPALPQLVRHDGWDWHLHLTAPDAPLATRLAVESAMALADVVRAGERDRLRTCAGEGCDRVLVDLSRNRSRRFCDGGCANRLHVAAYRARRAGSAGTAG